MTTAATLLKAPQVGVKEFRDHQAKYIHSHRAVILVHHGKRVKALLDFDEILELLEFIEEQNDKQLIQDVKSGRENALRRKTIPADDILAKHKASRSK